MKPLVAPRFTNKEIIQKAERLIEDFAIDYCGSKEKALSWFCINFDLIYEHLIYPTFGIELIEDEDLGYDSDGTKILGVTFPKSNTSYIDRILQHCHRDPRRAFTRWHEVGGHAILQGEWLREQLQWASSTSLVMTTEFNIEHNEIAIMERQANLYASHAAAPSWLLRHVIAERLGLLDPVRFIGPGRYSLVAQKMTRSRICENPTDVARHIAALVQYRFGELSLEALSYRILNEGYVTDETQDRGPALYRVASPEAIIRQPELFQGVRYPPIRTVVRQQGRQFPAPSAIRLAGRR